MPGMWLLLVASFDRTHFFTSKCLVAWNKSSVLHTSFSSFEYWHLSTRFLILWSSWSVDSLSPCLISGVDLVNVVPIGRRDTRVSTIALKTFSGSFWASSSVDISSVFHRLKPSLPRYPMMVANQMSWLILDAHNARLIWPFHSSKASCWSSVCQSNFGGWKTSCPPAMILEID